MRIRPAALDEVGDRARAVFAAQAEKWGSPLINHLIYVRRPSIFKGARGMWAGLDESALLEPPLIALINRRVANQIGCVF